MRQYFSKVSRPNYTTYGHDISTRWVNAPLIMDDSTNFYGLVFDYEQFWTAYFFTVGRCNLYQKGKKIHQSLALRKHLVDFRYIALF